MAVRMRLRRMGRKKKPFYRLVVAESRFARDGRFIEAVGYYNPMVNPADVKLNEERIMHWLSNGVQPTNTVKNILQKEGLWLKWDLTKKKTAPEKIEAEMKKWAEQQELKAKRREAEDAQKKAAKKEKKAEPVKEEAAPAEEKAPVEDAAPVEVKEEAAAEEKAKAPESPAEEPKADEAEEAKSE